MWMWQYRVSGRNDQGVEDLVWEVHPTLRQSSRRRCHVCVVLEGLVTHSVCVVRRHAARSRPEEWQDVKGVPGAHVLRELRDLHARRLSSRQWLQ